jgi:hypothetical protein
LFPAYLVSEYVLRRPLGALISLGERNHWADTLLDVFTFGPDHSAGIVPTAFFDFGLRPSIGVYAFWDNAFAKGNDLRAHVSYYGSDWIATSLTDRVHIGELSSVGVEASFVRRPDRVYAGEGPRTRQADQARYLGQRFEVGPAADVYLWRQLSWHAQVGVRTERFEDSTFDHDPSVGAAAAAGRFALPNDYVQGYDNVYAKSRLVFDTRRDKTLKPKTGVRAEARALHGTNLKEKPGASWIKYGGTAGGYVDLWRARVISLTVTADFADPLSGSGIPFTDEVVWGGDEPMSGFLPGRLHGRSAAAATVAYSWPIWVWLDGTMRASLGNVFDAGLRDLSAKLLRLSSGIGVQSSGSPDHRLEVLFGFATETFDQGGKIDSIRVVFGGTNGF